jgi:hypothetical protein
MWGVGLIMYQLVTGEQVLYSVNNWSATAACRVLDLGML